MGCPRTGEIRRCDPSVQVTEGVALAFWLMLFLTFAAGCAGLAAVLALMTNGPFLPFFIPAEIGGLCLFGLCIVVFTRWGSGA